MPSEVLDMPLRERLETILFEKVKHAHPVQFSNEAWVVAIVEMQGQVHAFADGQLCRFARER